jgi:hypothetical protein
VVEAGAVIALSVSACCPRPGERLDRVLEELRKTVPRLQARLVSAPVAERIARARTGELDAAFVRAVTTAADVELLPHVAGSADCRPARDPPPCGRAGYPPTATEGDPAAPGAREDNPPFHDLILGACADAGFDPLSRPPFTTPQDTLAEIGTGQPTWTVLYTAAASLMPVHRVAFRPLAGLTAQTCLAVPPGPPSPALQRLRRGIVSRQLSVTRHRRHIDRYAQPLRRFLQRTTPASHISILCSSPRIVCAGQSAKCCMTPEQPCLVHAGSEFSCCKEETSV